MTKLEQEIQEAITRALKSPKQSFSSQRGAYFTLTTVGAQASAEVARKYIERAFTFATYLGAAHNTSLNPEAYELEMIKWLKENGVTEG